MAGGDSHSVSVGLPRFIVIVGSAGSLTPLRTIVAALPPRLEATVVILIHRPPDLPSALDKVIGACASSPVITAENATRIEPGTIYVAPAGHKHLRVRRGGRFELWSAPRISFSRPSADPLLDSAAENFGARTVAVVLSGMGRNGVNGVKAVKQAGGLVFVQDPSEASSPSMPSHALAVVDVDLCAPSAELARRLAILARSPARSDDEDGDGEDGADHEGSGGSAGRKVTDPMRRGFRARARLRGAASPPR